LRKPTLIVVGADKGGVGKTTVSRTLLDYFDTLRVSVRAFDTEHPHGALKRFYPENASVVDMTVVRDQMKIFDSLNESQVTLIDVRAGLLSKSLAALRDIGLLEAVRRDQVSFGLLHVVGPSLSSRDEIPQITPFLSNSRYFVVKNYINDTQFFNWNGAAQKAMTGSGLNVSEIVIPKLNELAFEQVELASLPFTAFIANRGMDGRNEAFSFVLRGYVRHWLSSVWAEFDRVSLHDFVSAMEQKPIFSEQLPEHISSQEIATAST
jgi:hypothetical protein